MKVILNQPTEVIADKGYCLTNGEIYTDHIILGILDNIDNWREIPIEEVPIDE